MHAYRRWILLRWLLMAFCLAIGAVILWKTMVASSPVLRDRAASESEILARIEAMSTVAKGMARVRHARPAPDLGALFAIQLPRIELPAPPPSPAPSPAPPIKPPPMPFDVDMIIAAGEQGRAIISGRLTRIGDVLRDGSRVVDIQADAVTLRKNGQTRRLPAPRGRVAAPEDGS
jgi:hypothetical protein